MADRASSDDPRVQAQLDRLARLSPGQDILGLERISGLLARLGNPDAQDEHYAWNMALSGKGLVFTTRRDQAIASP